MSVKGQYELVRLLSHIDPGLLRLAVTEANGGHMPAGVDGVGIVAFSEACAQCVKLGTAPADQPWPFAAQWVAQLRKRDEASPEAIEVESALKRLEEWRKEIAGHMAPGGLPAATGAALRDAVLRTLAASRQRLAVMLDGLALAVTPDFQAWEVLAILAGRALRGELHDGYSHVPLNADLMGNLQSQYLSANAKRDAVWHEAWRRQAALLDLPPGWGGESPDQPDPDEADTPPGLAKGARRTAPARSRRQGAAAG